MRGGRAEECRGKGHGHRQPTSSSRSSRDLGTVPAQAGSSRQPLTVPQARIQSAGQGWAESSQVPRSCRRAGGAGPSSRLTAQEGPCPPSLESVSSTRDTRGPFSLPGLLPAWGEAGRRPASTGRDVPGRAWLLRAPSFVSPGFHLATKNTQPNPLSSLKDTLYAGAQSRLACGAVPCSPGGSSL